MARTRMFIVPPLNPSMESFTVKMNVLTGGIVAANPKQEKIVQILPLGLYRLTLDMGTQTVTIDPLKRVSK